MRPAWLREWFVVMRPGQRLASTTVASAVAAFATLGGLPGCELLVGELPQPVDEQLDAGSNRTAGGAGGAGGAGAGAAPAGGGTAATAGGAPSGGGGATGTGGGCVVACDCDGDGAPAKSCSGGTDCDDADREVTPRQTQYFDLASKAGSFDYDCSSTLERDPAQTAVVDCTLFNVATCNTTQQGFFGALPECGKSGSWGTCKKGTLSCDPDPRGTQTLRCR